MEFRVLGPLEVIGPDGRVRIASARQRSILALLILNIGETVSAARLIDELWGDDPSRSARHAVAVYLSRLRQSIGPGHIATEPGGYRLRTAGHVVDLERFECLSGQGEDAFAAGDPRTAAARFAAALALWRGSALDDLAVEHGLQAEQMRLNELRAAVRLRRIDADLACGRHGELVPELRQLVAEMPHREEIQARLMLALYRSSRQADSLDVYHAARTMLDHELGVEPGSELEAMQRAILRHDPSLRLEAATESRPQPIATADAQITEPVASPPEVATPTRSIEEAKLARAGPTRGAARRTVTVLMADIKGSTLTGELLDPESVAVPLDRCFNEMRAVLERHGGKVDQVVGDAVMAAFGVSVVHEDDALRAVRAASEMRDTLAELNDRLERDLGARIEMRAGVNTGDVMIYGGIGSAGTVSGEAVNIAFRLEQAAGPGEILLAEGTHNLVRWAVQSEPFSAVELDGRSGAISAVRLLSLTSGVGGHAHRFDSPLVGRARELRQLEAALRQTIADETCQLFTLLGAAGVGKSRLVHEFVGSIRPEAQVVRGHCPPYGERAAFWPLAEAIKQAAGVTDADTADVVRDRITALVAEEQRATAIAEHVAAIIGVSETPSTLEESSWAIGRTVEAIARDRPLVIVFDDVQWGERSFLDLIESIADTSRSAPILLLCIARPELLDARPGWGGGMLNSTAVLLKPLADSEVSRLVANLLGGSGAPAAIERKIVEATEGNPLFVEEFLAMLVDAGTIRRVNDDWIATTDLATIATPASIMALLAARLDRLPDDEREVLERAAVVGKIFTREAVDALIEQEELADVTRRLGALARREVIRPDRSAAGGPEAYRFKHILIRDAAYAGLPKQRRVDLHEGLADWLAGAAHDGRASDEVIGAHLEQAYRYRTELGPLDDRARTVGRLAAARLADVGRRALLRGEYRVATDLLSRAAALLPGDDRERLVLLADLTETLLGLGEFAAARRNSDELMKNARALGLDDLRWRATLDRIALDSYTAREGSPRASEDLRAAIHFFEVFGDDRALGWAWFLLGEAENDAGHLDSGRVAYGHALEHARRARDFSLEAYSLGTSVDLNGPTTVGAGTRAALELLDWAQASSLLWMEATALSFLARLKAMVGEFDEGRRLLESAIAIHRELNVPLEEVADVPRWIGLVEWLAGDPVAAERGLRRGYEALERLGETKVRAFIAAELARMLYLQRRYDEAFDFTRIAEAESSSLSAWTDIGWRGVRGMILVRRGDEAVGLALGREDVARAQTTDLLMVHARALEDLAEVFALSRRPSDARPLLEQAIDLYDQKGITVLADRTRRRLTTSAHR